MEAWLAGQKISWISSEGVAEAIEEYGAVDPCDLADLEDEDLDQL